MSTEQGQAAQPISSRAAGARRSGCLGRALFWMILIVWLAILLTGLAAAAGAWSIYRSDVILAGVSVLGVDLGGQSRAAAIRLLQSEWDSRTITVDPAPGISDGAGAGPWKLPPASLGLILDAEATVERAHAQWRSPGSEPELLRTAQQLLAMAPGFAAELGLPFPWRVGRPERIELEPVWRFEPGVAAASLRRLADQVAVAPRSASLRIVDGRVETTPPVSGRALDLTAALRRIEQNPWQVFGDRRLPVSIVAVTPPVTDVSAAASQARRLLASPIAVRLYDPYADQRFSWTISPQTIGGWLVLRSLTPAPDTPAWEVDSARVRAFVGEQEASLRKVAGPGAEQRYVDLDVAVPAIVEAVIGGTKEVRLRVLHTARQHIVGPGETLSSIAIAYGVPYPWIMLANEGTGDTLRVGQKLTIPSVDGLLPLPPIENKRIKVSIAQQRMWAYENGALKWEWPVSTGIASSPTAPGVFQIQSHETNAYAGNWDLWMPYFMGVYRPVPDQAFMNGFHGFPTRGGSQLLWTNSLGRPVTFGCILLSTANAKTLYEWAEEGVVVEISP